MKEISPFTLSYRTKDIKEAYFKDSTKKKVKNEPITTIAHSDYLAASSYIVQGKWKTKYPGYSNKSLFSLWMGYTFCQKIQFQITQR